MKPRTTVAIDRINSGTITAAADQVAIIRRTTQVAVEIEKANAGAAR